LLRFSDLEFTRSSPYASGYLLGAVSHRVSQRTIVDIAPPCPLLVFTALIGLFPPIHTGAGTTLGLLCSLNFEIIKYPGWDKVPLTLINFGRVKAYFKL
jgi:hypothetical protein